MPIFFSLLFLVSYSVSFIKSVVNFVIKITMGCQLKRKIGMDNKTLLNFVDAALSGDSRAVQMSLRKLISKTKDKNQELYREFVSRVSNDALRAATTNKPIPVDSDSRLQLVKFEVPKSTFKKPIHSDSVQRALSQVLEEREHSLMLLEEGLIPARTIIFEGPPGVGKTISARWLANELGMPLLVLDLATVMSSFLGKTGNNIRSVLDHASSFPCVLLLDEFDSIAKRRDDDKELGELKRLVTVLLQAIDDWPESSLLIAATNHAELLDPAIWRRFDVEVSFELPDKCMRREYIAEYWPELISEADGLAVKFENMSYSDISREINRAKKESILKKKSICSCLYFSELGDLKKLPLVNKKQLARKMYLEGISQRAIAQQLGMSRPTVRKAIEPA